MVLAYQTEGEIPQRFAAIELIIGTCHQEVLEKCEARLAHAGNNHFPFLPRFYRSHRATLFRFLNVVELKSSSQDTSVVEAIEFLKSHLLTGMSTKQQLMNMVS